jgi:hypothetical protein
VAIVVGDPIDPPSAGGRRVPRQEITNVTEKVRVELQSCFDEALALAGVPIEEPHSRSGSELRQHE